MTLERNPGFPCVWHSLEHGLPASEWAARSGVGPAHEITGISRAVIRSKPSLTCQKDGSQVLETNPQVPNKFLGH